MVSRKLISAAAALLIACLASPAGAQNLEAGKTPSQIFTQTCSLCHKSSRGLLKTVPPGSLAAFLRQHYTTSADMASLLSAYVLSNGATDTRLGGDNLTKQGKEARAGTGPESKPSEGKPSEGRSLEATIFGNKLFESKPSESKPSESKPSEASPEAKPKTERRTREASRPDVDNLENVPGAPSPARDEPAPPEARQKDKKQRFDKRKSPISTVKQEPNVGPSTVARPAEAAKNEPGDSGQGTAAPAVAPVPGAAEPPQQTAKGKSSNMPVFVLEPQPQAEAVPSGPPRAPAGPPVVPISQ